MKCRAVRSVAAVHDHRVPPLPVKLNGNCAPLTNGMGGLADEVPGVPASCSTFHTEAFCSSAGVQIIAVGIGSTGAGVGAGGV